MTPNPHSQSLRKGRRSEPGHYYLVTAVTLNRQPIFKDLESARLLIRILREASLRNQAQTWAFVVMPDHFHWLLQLEETSLSETIRRVKRVASAQLGKRVWQDGFHDRAVRGEENLKAMARYVIANPVRAGLVETVGDYPHWDAAWL
ncbi:REP-associated tyrosine transposase [Pseudomonas saliphila]|uniref:REP-associated tyrosine transposase n=1 Tax=Pseudomonas saliphila TaxID=2586906 RepID=UPI00123ABEAC|nr:transposase [Pseudomonas saliphila]